MTDTKTNKVPPAAKNAAKDVVEKTRDAAADAADAAKGEAMAKADAAKSSLAGEVDTVASALRDASGDLADGTPQERAAAQAADTLDSVAKTIRDADLGEFVTATTRFARRNPAAFLGSAALLGFAAARFAKASAEDDAQGDDTGEPAALPAPGTRTRPAGSPVSGSGAGTTARRAGDPRVGTARPGVASQETTR